MIPTTLNDTQRSRIISVAQGHSSVATLKVKHGSGKTLELWIGLPGLAALDRCVVRLHRKLHKAFYALVKAAQEWLAGYKALFAPVNVLLLPATVTTTTRTPTAMLAAGAAKVTAEQPTYAYSNIPKVRRLG